MHTYSYADCLSTSLRVNWRVEDVLGDDSFDPTRPWLPSALSAVDGITCLTERESMLLTQVEMVSYAHLFGYVEEFVAPQVVQLAAEQEDGDRIAFQALTNFAAEEVKHMRLFREVRERCNAALGFEAELIDGADATARYVLSRNRGAVLLLTAAIEWFTQLHFVEAFKGDESIDPLTKRIFRAHWLEEAQHAKLDHLEALRAFDGMDEAERDSAVDHLIELVGALDGLLQAQSNLDVINFERHARRALSSAHRAEVRREVLLAKRWTFLESGVTHPRFLELFRAVTTGAQRDRVDVALAPLVGGRRLAMAV